MFIDAYAGKESEAKKKIAKELEVKIAPGDYSLFVSNNAGEVRKKRMSADFVAGEPKTKQEMNALLPDTFYDFMIVNFPLGKRNVRMAKRHETAVAIPLAPAFTLKISEMLKLRKNLKLVQTENCPLLLVSGAASEAEIRSGRDLAAIGVLFGLKPDFALKAVSKTPEKILEFNAKRKKQPCFGVEVKE
jgi:RNase P/RNase MRP subunit p30